MRPKKYAVKAEFVGVTPPYMRPMRTNAATKTGRLRLMSAAMNALPARKQAVVMTTIVTL